MMKRRRNKKKKRTMNRIIIMEIVKILSSIVSLLRLREKKALRILKNLRVLNNFLDKPVAIESKIIAVMIIGTLIANPTA